MQTDKMYRGHFYGKTALGTPCKNKNARHRTMSGVLWSQQGMILRPPDYESGATNQLSYGTKLIKELICSTVQTVLNRTANIILFSIS